MRLPLPTTIVTGALGVGKTTVIASLLTRRPAGEKWAVLVNEFGALGIDGALLELAGADALPADPCSDDAALETRGHAEEVTEGVAIKQLAGGCMCCVASGMFAPAVAMLIRQAKPDRLLIEPSGLGHPAGLIDILQNKHLKSAIQLQAVICLVHPAYVNSLEGLYLDQVNIADVVVASKADLSSSQELDAFHAWAQQLYPPKKAVAVVAKGELDISLLQADLHQRSPGLHLHSPHARPHDHSPHGSTPPTPVLDNTGSPAPGKPRRHVAMGGAGSAAGWVFSPEDIFQEVPLLALLQALWSGVERVKGVFRTDAKRWVTPTLARADSGDTGCDGAEGRTVVRLVEIAYRQDSRVEVIVGHAEQSPCKGGDHSACNHAGCHGGLPGAASEVGASLLAGEASSHTELELSSESRDTDDNDNVAAVEDGVGALDVVAAARAGAWDEIERALLRLTRGSS